MGNNELKPNIRWNSWSNNPFNENIWYTKKQISYWQTLCNNLVILTFKYFFWQSKRANVIFYQNWWCWTLFFLAFKSLLYFVTLYFCVFLQFGPHLYFFDLRLDKRRKWWCGVMHVICITPAYHSSVCISNGPSKIAYFALPNI